VYSAYDDRCVTTDVDNFDNGASYVYSYVETSSPVISALWTLPTLSCCLRTLHASSNVTRTIITCHVFHSARHTNTYKHTSVSCSTHTWTTPWSLFDYEYFYHVCVFQCWNKSK